MSKAHLVLTAVGPDKSGTVEMITDIIVANSANIEESKMARLGGEFAVIMLLSLPEEKVQDLIVNLDTLQDKGLTIVTRRTDFSRLTSFRGFVPYDIVVLGADHEGIVNRVARYLASENINVEEMDTYVTNAPNTGTPLFSMFAKVQVPPEVALSKLRRKLAEVGDELDVDIDVKVPAA